MPYILKDAQGQPALPRQIDQPPCRPHGNGKRLLGQKMEAGLQHGGADLVVQRQRGKIVDGIYGTTRDQLAVVGKDLHVDIILEITQIGVGRRERVARCGIEDRRPWRRTLPTAAEHQGILFAPGAQGRNTEVVDA